MCLFSPMRLIYRGIGPIYKNSAWNRRKYIQEVQGRTEESEDFHMELRVVTLENGMKAVTWDKPAPTPEQSAFAAELERVAEAAKKAEASGSTKEQAAWSSLTPTSKEILERMKAEEPDITEEEWDRLKRELAAIGLISQNDLAHTVNGAVVVGKLERGASGEFFGAGSVTIKEAAPNFEIEWIGDPLKYMNEWIWELRKQMNEVPGRAGQVESYEKLYNVVSKLLEMAVGSAL